LSFLQRDLESLQELRAAASSQQGQYYCPLIEKERLLSIDGKSTAHTHSLTGTAVSVTKLQFEAFFTAVFIFFFAAAFDDNSSTGYWLFGGHVVSPTPREKTMLVLDPH
jgi:hypothetical protein